MIGVAGIWELGWSVPIVEADMWQMSLREFGVKELHMTPITGIDKKWIHEYSTMDELLLANHDAVPVFVDEKAECELTYFTHPQDALYVFGKGNWSPFNNMAKDHASVRIGSTKPGMLWPHQALAIVLYDRLRK